MYQSLSFDAERERRALPFYTRSNRGLVFVTKPSRKQNLFFQNKFIIFWDRKRHDFQNSLSEKVAIHKRSSLRRKFDQIWRRQNRTLKSFPETCIQTTLTRYPGALCSQDDADGNRYDGGIELYSGNTSERPEENQTMIEKIRGLEEKMVASRMDTVPSKNLEL
jgi:hypothetical protein